MEKKICLLCPKTIIKKPKDTWVAFYRKKYCSNSCRLKNFAKINIGKKPKNFESMQKIAWQVNKGCAPWNKGKRGEYHIWGGKRQMSESWKKNISNSNKLLKTGKKHSLETRRKRSKSLCGENAPNWQGGITAINFKIRGSLDYRLWRDSVFKRDNYICIWCGARNGTGKAVILNADHIVPFSVIYRNDKLKHLLFDISNGRTLCRECHKKTDTWAGKARKHELYLATSS